MAVATETTASVNGSDAIEQVPLQQIKLNTGSQPREDIDNSLVVDYAESMINGDVFPPVELFFDGKAYYASDGFHRIRAALRIKAETIAAVVRSGGQRDAIYASLSANHQHGKRRSLADIRRVVTRMLEDDEWTRLSDSAIARHCHVDNRFVSGMRVKLGIAGPANRVCTRNGKQYVTNTRNMGQHKKKPPVLETPDFTKAATEIVQKTSPTMLEAFVSKIRARGIEARTHVDSPFGPIDIVTPDALYIIAGALTPRVFRDAFTTLFFQRERKGADKRAVIVGTSNDEVAHWIKAAKKLGVEFTEFKG